jgi:DNA-directed RNA polymerase specialized sigma24 family protein
VPVPPPPRGDHDFKVFYREKRSSMIALATALGGNKLHDPEHAAETGWQRFYPHWRNCSNPTAYLRKCVTNAVRDELRAAAGTPLIVHLGDHDELAQIQLPSARRRTSPERSWKAWKSWDPPLAQAIAELSDKLREAVVLDTELNPGERTVAEIAQILGINRITAHMRLKRAYAQLEQLLLNDYLEERKERLRDVGGLEERSAP